MRSFIQLTDTKNDVYTVTNSLGDLSSTTTYSFRVWNNFPQSNGVAAVNGLKLKLMTPPKQGIQTLVNENAIQVRCTYSGKRSETLSTSFQPFPIEGTEFDRLEPNCYNEYEVQIDFSSLSALQKASIEMVDMEYNITVDIDTEYIPFGLPTDRDIVSDTRVLVLGQEKTVVSDTLIV